VFAAKVAPWMQPLWWPANTTAIAATAATATTTKKSAVDRSADSATEAFAEFAA